MNVADLDAQRTAEQLRVQIAKMPVGSSVFETKHRRKDGEILDVEISATRVYLDGKPYLYAASRDITERKRTELAGRVQERYGITRDEAEKQVKEWEDSL